MGLLKRPETFQNVSNIHVRHTAWPARVLVGQFEAWRFVLLGQEDGSETDNLGLNLSADLRFFRQIDF